MSELLEVLQEINVMAVDAGGELIIEPPEQQGDSDTLEDLTEAELQIALNHVVLKTERPRKDTGRIG